MRRSANTELTQRINDALILVKELPTTPEAATILMKRYGVSKRQAYRYIQQAQKVQKVLPVPEPKEVFTVKLPKSLVHRLRVFGRSRGKSLSFLVTQALETFLQRK